MDAAARSLFSKYLRLIQDELQSGNATERTHYPALKALMESLQPEVKASVEPKRIECGAPDFIVTRGNIPLGYIEAKDVGVSLRKAERSEQLKRYFNASLPNIILTDFITFRWYFDGNLIDESKVGRVGRDNKIKADAGGVDKTYRLLTGFLEKEYPSVGTPKDLAERLARLAHLCRETIVSTFNVEDKAGSLHTQLEAFRDNLIPDLKPEDFADMYAQTIAYGFFAARCECENPKKFSRWEAARLIPKTNPFLRKFFDHVAGSELDGRIEWVVDDLVELLRRADMAEVLREFGRRTRREDPVVHFYETFLKAYDPKMREMRGVYYTPEPVVSYIVRAVDDMLKEEFDRPDGLADPGVYILDPACGTSTFLFEVVKHIYEHLRGRGQAGAWDNYVEKRLLPRLFGFELLMAPYAVAHLKLSLLLKELGYRFKSNERINIYLTNSLEEAMKKSQVLPFARFISEEADTAAEIKKDLPIMVVLGNPPYSGHSANRSYKEMDIQKGEKYEKRVGGRLVEKVAKKNMKLKVPTFIGRLIDDYKYVEGAPLGERNPKWLQDDYVKFIRFAQWRIEQTGHGIVGYISNHAYLDNPTFRGMRQSLMKTFDTIDLLDLHGNARKKEVCPDGSKDENVFDIQQGVAIGIFTRLKECTGKSRVRHGDIWGTRDAKEKTLMGLSPKSRMLKKISPLSPSYYFVRRDTRLMKEYESGQPLTSIFPANSAGIVTARDKLTIGWSSDEVWKAVRDFINRPIEATREKFELGRDTRDWKVALAQEDIRSNGPSKKQIVPIMYRPFDVRFTYYTGQTRGFICMPRKRIMRHMLEGNNLGLISARSNKSPSADHFFCSRFVTEAKCGESTTQSYLFPLYLFEGKDDVNSTSGGGGGGSNQGMMVFEPRAKYDVRRANLNRNFIRELEAKLKLRFVETGKGDLKKTFGPEDVFHYIYAIFHAPTYRERYAEFLKSDFPRVPLTSRKPLFKKLTSFGEELVALHLMESPRLDGFITAYNVPGDNLIEKVRYVDNRKRAYINKEQFFDGVPQDVWEFHVGGYRVCEKWLKDRKGGKLAFDDIRHYQRMVVALNETIRLMQDIDRAVPQWPID